MEILEKFLAASPIGAGLIIMTVLFLRYVARRDDRWQETVKDMNSKQLMSHDRCSDAVKESTEVMGRVKQLLETRIKQVGGEHG